MKKLEIGNWIFEPKTLKAGFVQNIIFEEVTLYFPDFNNEEEYQSRTRWQLLSAAYFGNIHIFDSKKDYLAYRIKQSV